jgi:hypothetical protein
MYLFKGPAFNIVVLCGYVEGIAFLILKIRSRKQQHSGNMKCVPSVTITAESALRSLTDTTSGSINDIRLSQFCPYTGLSL